MITKKTDEWVIEQGNIRVRFFICPDRIIWAKTILADCNLTVRTGVENNPAIVKQLHEFIENGQYGEAEEFVMLAVGRR